MMNPFSWLQMTNMISYQGLVRTFPRAEREYQKFLREQERDAIRAEKERSALAKQAEKLSIVQAKERLKDELADAQEEYEDRCLERATLRQQFISLQLR